jgi:tetratricopeptide (TPR) repeat protein
MVENRAGDRNKAIVVASRGLAATIVLAGAVVGASSALAVGGASGGNFPSVSSGAAPPAPSGSVELKTCDKGLVWDKKQKKCVLKHSGVLPDAEMTEYAYALAKEGRYEEAIDVLDTLQNPITPRALNYRGYATRKLGRTEEGIGYYLQSIALDPQYAQVREYLGEAYVVQGKFELAKEQLAIIKAICGSNTCDEYDDLERALVYAHGL